MGAVEDARQVLQDFLAPELLEARAHRESVEKRFDILEKGYDVRSQALVQRLDAIEDANAVRYQAVIQRLDQIQQSFAFDKRNANLEAEKTRSAQVFFQVSASYRLVMPPKREKTPEPHHIKEVAGDQEGDKDNRV